MEASRRSPVASNNQLAQSILDMLPDVPTGDVVRQNVSAGPMAVDNAQDTLEVIQSRQSPVSYSLGAAASHRPEVPPSPFLTQPYRPLVADTIDDLPSAPLVPSETFVALYEASKIIGSELSPAVVTVWPRLDDLRAQVLEAKHLAYGDTVITGEIPVLSRQNVRHATAMCNRLEHLFAIATQLASDAEAVAAVETLADLAEDSQIVAETILSILMMHLDDMAGLMRRSDTLGSALRFVARLSTGIGSACLPDLLDLVKTLDRDFTFLVQKACDPAHAVAVLPLLCALSDATPQTHLAISQALSNGWQNLRFAVVKPLTLPWVTKLLQAAIDDGVIPAADVRQLLRGRAAIEVKPAAPLQVTVEDAQVAEEFNYVPPHLAEAFERAMSEKDFIKVFECIEGKWPPFIPLDTYAPIYYEVLKNGIFIRSATHTTTALGLAAFLGEHRIVDYLIEKGASVTSNSLGSAMALHMHCSKNPIKWTMAFKLIEAGKLANITWGISEKTLLRSAVKTETIWAIRKLLKLGANVNFVNKKGKTALDEVPCKGIFRKRPNAEIVAILRDAGGKTAQELAQSKAELR